MSKKKTKFSDIWVNQTVLGKQFGLSAIAMGKQLKELGLRSKETGTPTQEAIENGFCQSTPLKDGTPFFMWNKAKVAELMQAQGHEKLDAKEIKYRELADDWMRVYKRFQEAVSGIEDEMCYEEAQDIKKQAKRAGLIERVNEIMRDRKFDGELIA
ncbi:MAG TPA: hypothetical protein DCY88_16280 [Cyanobacteria bacterium UBA11372]|nr:hypothetical protein [Cyanobacteria bacterium UBA11372]